MGARARPRSLTRDLDDARRLSDDIDARLAANEEVRRLLRADP